MNVILPKSLEDLDLIVHCNVVSRKGTDKRMLTPTGSRWLSAVCGGNGGARRVKLRLDCGPKDNAVLYSQFIGRMPHRPAQSIRQQHRQNLRQKHSLEEFGSQVLEKGTQASPRGRIAGSKDVANMVTLLASDNARFVTGEAYNLNGGLLFN